MRRPAAGGTHVLRVKRERLESSGLMVVPRSRLKRIAQPADIDDHAYTLKAQLSIVKPLRGPMPPSMLGMLDQGIVLRRH